jgi:hypothetical protein
VRVRSAALGVLGALGVGAATLLACEGFEPSAASASDGGSDASSDATDDASARTVMCGEETCTLPNEVCCVFSGNNPPARFCAEGTCPARAPTDASHSQKVRVSCDDDTDCTTPGNVCCAASASSCSVNFLDVVECRAPSACGSCAADSAAGVGFHLCRATVETGCLSGSCTGTFGSQGPWTDYRFCR